MHKSQSQCPSPTACRWRRAVDGGGIRSVSATSSRRRAAQEREQITRKVGARHGVRSELHTIGAWGLTQQSIRDSDYGAVGDGRVRDQRVLDLRWVDVHAAG